MHRRSSLGVRDNPKEGPGEGRKEGMSKGVGGGEQHQKACVWSSKNTFSPIRNVIFNFSFDLDTIQTQ